MLRFVRLAGKQLRWSSGPRWISTSGEAPPLGEAPIGGGRRGGRGPPRRRHPNHRRSSPSQMHSTKGKPSSSPEMRVPHSLDRAEMEDRVDVERHFPRAISHLTAPTTSAFAAEEQQRRQWHTFTHAVNVDGVQAAGQETEEDRKQRTHSFFEQGGVDIRGGLEARAAEAGTILPSRQEATSPDVLELTGGRRRRHGLALAEESNASPADTTMEGEEATFGDTPVQLTDMLRERLMELKTEKMKSDRHETFMPKRLNLPGRDGQRTGAGAAQSLLALAQQQDASPKRRHATTLADLDEEPQPASVAAVSPAQRDGASAGGMDLAARFLDSAEAYLPGSRTDPLDDPLGESPSLSSAESNGAVFLLRVLPRAGYCSRREANTIIASGEVRVNNVVERNPFRLVRAEDDVHVSGHQARLRFAPPRLWMYHKPSYVIVSRNDVAGRALISRHARILGMDHLIPVGSLPMRAHGVLMMTNDGELSRFLENPASQIQQTYLLRVRPSIDPVLAHRLNTEGIHINGRQYKDAEFFVNPAMKSRYSLKVKLRGETLPVAHLMQHLGRRVERGGRISFGPFSLSGLAVGSMREVTVPPHYLSKVGAIWRPFIERDWPYFRRQRVTRLRRLARYRELTPGEAEELDHFTYEEINDAMSFSSQELSNAAAERAALLHNPVSLKEEAALTHDFPMDEPTRLEAHAWSEGADDHIVEDITRV